MSYQPANTYLELTGLSAGALNAFLVPSTDVSSYKWVSFQITAVATGGTITFQGSNDNTNWVNLVLYTLSSTPQTGFTSSSSAGVYAGPTQYRYFRAQQTAWTSGSSTGVAEFYSTPAAAITQSNLATQQGNWSVRLQDTNGNGIGEQTAADAIATQTSTLGVTNFPEVYNGTTFDRQRSASAATGTTGTGLTGAGILGFDGTNFRQVKTDTLGNVSVSQLVATTSALTSVAAAITSTTLLALNANRKGAYFYNDSTAILYIALAATAATTAYTVQLPANGYYEMPEKPIYTGAITSISSAANGNVRVTELS